MSIYLDYQATTPLAPEVLEAMLPWLRDNFANPHSPSREGRAAAAAIDIARTEIAALLPPGGRVFFTSGATEALNWALQSTPQNGALAVSETEHAAVRDTASWLAHRGRPVHFLPVNSDGLLDPGTPLPNETRLAAVMFVNNEIGVIQPIAELADAAHQVGALFLCDAVQGFGRMPIPAGPDMIAISAHKIHGPKGIGALWVRDGVDIAPLIHGGGQESGLRSGTLSPALCAGFGAAAKLAASRMAEDAAHIARLWDAAMATLPAGWQINGSTSQRYKGNLNIRKEGVDVSRLISDLRHIAFSAGSACASGSGRPSHVLKALGLTTSQAKSALRIGFGRTTAEEDLRSALKEICRAADAKRQAKT